MSNYTGSYDDDLFLDDAATATTEPTMEPTEFIDYWPAYCMWIQKVFSFLSMLCSYVICRECFVDQRNYGRRRSNVNKRKNGSNHRDRRDGLIQPSIARMLFHLSLSDIIFSFALFLGEWPAPYDTDYIHHAKGNSRTCTFQGWLVMWGYLASPMFSIGLNLFYLLLVKYRWVDERLWKLEIRIVIGIWLYTFIMSIIPIPFQAYNSDWDVCWLVPYPIDCIGEQCTKGLKALEFEYYTTVHVWTCLIISIGLMIALFHTVRQIEKKSPRFSLMKRKLANDIEVGAIEQDTSKGTTSSTNNDEEEGNNIINNNKDDNDDGDKTLPQTVDRIESQNIDTDADPEGITKEETKGTSMTARQQLFSLSLSSIGSFFVQTVRQSAISAGSGLSSQQKKSRIIAYKGILFSLVFLSTHLCEVVGAMIIWRVHEFWNFEFDLITYTILQPMLGILNFFIFCRKRNKMTTPEGRILRNLVCCFPLCMKKILPRNHNNVNDENKNNNNNIDELEQEDKEQQQQCEQP